MQTQVRILDISLLEDKCRYQEAYSLCAGHRQKKADALRQAADKRRSVGAWLLLRYMLNELGYDANAQQLAYAVCGKPFFSSLPEIHFNFSHSRKLVLCALSNRAVGCDVERINRLNEKTINRCFHQDEIEAIRCGGVDLPEKIWTLKESVSKCIGSGITLPFDSFSVCSDGRITDELILSGETFLLYELSVEPGYAAALCVEGKNRIQESIICQVTDISCVLG